tara:strand:- start:2994 stop:3605 length:612 start_codon:yes stop_codon:yes gene_type:complete
LDVSLFLSKTDTGNMKLILLRILFGFLVTIHCSFGSPCIQWILYSPGESSQYFHDEFIVNYHLSFPEHLKMAPHAACSSSWRIEGYIYRNTLKVPKVDSVFGVVGGEHRSRSVIAQLNLSIYDLQIPDRDSEHVLIEYSFSNQNLGKKELIIELTKSLNQQLLSIMDARTIAAPVRLHSNGAFEFRKNLNYWIKRMPNFRTLR